MAKLVIVVGDYGGGTVESALKNGEDLSALRSGDSADGRVFNEIIRQDPDVSRIVTLPIARQFSPNSAGEITRLAVRWAFEQLEQPKPGFEDIDEVTVVANVAPGVKTLNGGDVSQNGNNLDREAFVSGTVNKGGRSIVLGSTNAFLDGEGHTLGPSLELEQEGYEFSDFRPVGGAEAERLLRENGQFRSRALLAYMNARDGGLDTRKGNDVVPTAREQHALVPPELREQDRNDARQVFENMFGFLPVRAGDPRRGFVTVISEARHADALLAFWSGQPEHEGKLFNALGFDGNETNKDKELIAQLSPAQQAIYQLTRQAHLAANLANEFDEKRGAGQRTIIIDSEQSQLTDPKKFYDVTLNNGSHIITSNPLLLALTTDTIESITRNGQPLDGVERTQFLTEANRFRTLLQNRAIENDPYRNVKLGKTFGGYIGELLGNLEIPQEKAVEIILVARTGGLEEERVVYYTPSSAGSFGIWGHSKLSSGSTLLDARGRDKCDFQAEIFTPGSPTAGNVFTVIPGVTEFDVSGIHLVDKSKLEEPGAVLLGENRTSEGLVYNVRQDAVYNRIHGQHVGRIVARRALQETEMARSA